MERFPITETGLNKLKIDLKKLKTEDRPNIIQAISEARALGDLSENAEYHSAREKQSFIEGRILELEGIISRADVIDVQKMSGTKVRFGATVTVVDEDTDEESTYQIVGEYEADIEQNKISFTSPIARAMIGKDQGDSIEVVTPKASKSYEILVVEYK